MAVNKQHNVNNSTLLEQIRALSFVKTEVELYLDTHPNCSAALDYYYRTISELERLTEIYENEAGPLSAAGVRSEKNWTWVEEPWPWQFGNGRVREENN